MANFFMRRFFFPFLFVLTLVHGNVNAQDLNEKKSKFPFT